MVKNLLFCYGVLLLFIVKYSFANLQVPTRFLELHSQGCILVILGAVFSLFSLLHCGFWIPLMPPLKTRGACSLCPSVNETDTTLLFDIDVNL